MGGRIKERVVKQELRGILRLLSNQGYPIYWRMPVPSGYDKPGLDFEGCLAGRFFAIETKAPGQWLTPRQRDTAASIYDSGGKVFIVSNREGITAFVNWVVKCNTVPTDRLIARFADYVYNPSPKFPGRLYENPH